MSWVYVALTVATTAASIYSADKASSNAHQAQDQAKANALVTQQQADEANNRANAKSPDLAAALSANALFGKTGQSGTMLTGPGGIDPSQLTLGKSSLLGG